MRGISSVATALILAILISLVMYLALAMLTLTMAYQRYLSYVNSLNSGECNPSTGFTVIINGVPVNVSKYCLTYRCGNGLCVVRPSIGYSG